MKMQRAKTIVGIFIFFGAALMGQNHQILYLFPGQGSDARIFSGIRFDSSSYTVRNVIYPVPEKGASLKDYAAILSRQIDTSQSYSFIGMSLGGMICAELKKAMHPQQVIIISSAKCRSELPGRYKFQKIIPLYALIPKGLVKLGARFLQPIVEPDRKKNKAIFKSMLKQKDKRFLKRTVAMIIRWDNVLCDTSIIHIHGTNDHTLPIRKTKPDYVIQHGSHMMTLTRANEVESLLNKILLK